MPEITEITEMDDLEVSKLSLVARGANGFAPLVAKAALAEVDAVKAGEGEPAAKEDVEDAETAPDEKTGEKRTEEAEKEAPAVESQGLKVTHEDVQEIVQALKDLAPKISAEDVAREVAALKATLPSGEPHDTDTDSSEADEIQRTLTEEAAKSLCGAIDCDPCHATLDGIPADVAVKAVLRAKQRHALPDSDFAYIDSKGGRHLPIHDEAHVRAAMGRFNQQQFESSSAKRKAAAKIKARAKSMGIKVSNDSNVSTATKSPGVPDFSVATPKAAGQLKTSQSGLFGNVTKTCPTCDGAGYVAEKQAAFLRPGMACPTCLGKGVVIPAENRQDRSLVPNRAAHYPDNATGVGKTSGATDDLIEVVDSLEKAPQVSADNTSSSTTPGSPSWEAYDSATLDSVAAGLAACGRAVEAIRQREAVEAVTDPSDWQDACDLDTAGDAINCALGFVARLAYREGAEGLQKAGKRLSAASEQSIRSARDHLTDLLGEGATPTTSEEDDIMATLTKEDLAALVTDAAKDAASGPAKQAKKAAKDAAKASKIARQALKAAKRNTQSNNNGEVTAEDERGAVSGHADASNVGVAGGTVRSEFKARKSDKRLEKQLAALAEVVAKVDQTVTKVAKAPRSGGPILDGATRPFIADERSDGPVTKTESEEITKLQKQYDEASDVVRKAELGQQLTHARLMAAHEQGLI